jgi:hypothetical protein
VEAIKKLDPLNSQITEHVYSCAPMANWVTTKATLAFVPDGSVGSRTFHFVLVNGTVDKGSSPIRTHELAIAKLAEEHWKMTQAIGQPRWYKMTVTVERAGRSKVEFEYKDNYKEGDISRDH